ncbi:DUF484 family protein [Paracoccus aminophilus]|uniref:DUF484 family protein n=1 Tax=Paracoccus aminophilus JCM 7686 TaxID=1367847 RepID=S5XR16_PARAH|nr:DUF484 family protein [Paracoccus aminophilus]AGT07507.1 hypothetical protein JCM7686_0398 [Paracoccus aminophilus JCM 7686]
MTESESSAAPTESKDLLAGEIRQYLLSHPELILGDRDVMRALVDAREADFGANVIDIRGRAMQALEERLDRLETAHETVISNAYENQSGMNMIHRAVLALLEPVDFQSFLENLNLAVAPILRIETLRLIFETGAEGSQPKGIDGALDIVAPGTIAALIHGGRRAPRGDNIVLRDAVAETQPLHGPTHAPILTEALLPIDLGPGRWPALLLMGSTEAGRFAPSHGTDLLRFFSQVFRLVLLDWLSE